MSLFLEENYEGAYVCALAKIITEFPVERNIVF